MPYQFSHTQYALVNDMLDHVETYEKLISYPYLDNKNYITVGIGYNIQAHGGKDRFMEMPWMTKHFQVYRPATHDEKEEAFTKLDRMKNKNRSASAYASITSLQLDKNYVRELARDKVKDSVKFLYQKFDPVILDRLKPAQRVVLTDIIYNVGQNRFNNINFENLFKAVQNNDATAMAKESIVNTGKTDGKFNRNWERVIDNYSKMKGISRQQAIKELAIIFKDKMDQELNPPPPDLKKELDKLKGWKTTGGGCHNPVNVRSHIRSGMTIPSYERHCPVS